MADSFQNGFLRDEDGAIAVVGKGGDPVGGGDVTQAELDDAVAALTTLSEANTARINGTFRVFQWDGDEWIAVDGQAFDLDDRAAQSDFGRPYFFQGPDTEIQALIPEDFDLAVRTD